MKKLAVIILCCVLAQVIGAQSPSDVKSFKLDNGLTVWLNEDHTQSSVFGAVVVNAGSKDSPATGMAHYFEHIMFKGTDKIGTINYEAEKIYLDSIAVEYDLLAKTTDEIQRKEIQKEINRLSIEAAQYAIPNEFNTLLSQMGGSGINAGTSYDKTIYYNTFVPQYINQWLELNSERLINPVFRLFQSELETVYEEKNMYDDQTFNKAFEKLFERLFMPHPYQYPIIGITEHLKNPQLSEMEKFYNDYYKAGNMGLILSGDFSSEEIMPVIKEKFGRIQAGNAPENPIYEIPPFKGKETEHFLVPIPFVKISTLAWRGIPVGSSDENALNVALKLLSNNSSTGYLNMLGTDGKLLAAEIESLNMNDAGILIAIVIPKLFFQSYAKAEKLIINEIERIKTGDFTEGDLQSVKMEMKRNYEMGLESLQSKANTLLDVFSQGKEWADYLKEMEQIDKLTKADIVEVANRYFIGDYLYCTKKTGRYKDEKVQKPGFAPIVPQNKGEESEYAKKLIEEAASTPVVRPRTIDFEKDVITTQITPLITLYTKENPVNGVFTMKLNYMKGTNSDKLIAPMSEYMSDLSTDSLSYKEFMSGLQKLGGTINFNSNEYCFGIDITGFEENIEPILQYVSHFMTNVKPDKKALKRGISGDKFNRRAMRKEPDNIADAIYEYVIHGKNSTYLTMPSVKAIKKKGKDGLLDIFYDVIKTECDIHYAGNLPTGKVKNLVNNYFETDKITQKAYAPVFYDLNMYDKPVVFVVDNPKAKQSIVNSYTFTPNELDEDFLASSNFFNTYFGRGMSSIIFQEIREFRSLAYGAYSQYNRPRMVHKDKGSYLKCHLSTQSDKTIEALSVLDSLLKDMPQRPENIVQTKQVLRNNINSAYPSFRNISPRIAYLKRIGYNDDLNNILLNKLDGMDMNTLADFYNHNVKSKTTCYVITGNLKDIDMDKLKSFGEVKVVKMKEIF